MMMVSVMVLDDNNEMTFGIFLTFSLWRILTADPQE